MISKYIEAALARAHYEIVENENTYFGNIPGFDGLWANAPTLEQCREELRQTLEDWLLLSLRLNKPIPVVDAIDLTVRNVA